MAKVQFGLKNVYYAVVTETTVGGVTTSTYGTPKAWPGAVNLSLDPAGEDSDFYADDGVYYTLGNNSGYEGDFESALVPDDAYTDIYGSTSNTDEVIVESASDTKKYIALMFEIQGDVKARRHVMYRCSLTRPAVASGTKEDTTEPQTQTVTIKATPRPDDGLIKAFTKDDVTETVYSNWFTAVYTP